MFLPDLSREQRGSVFVIHKASTAVSMDTGQVAEHNEGPRRAKNNADLGTALAAKVADIFAA